MVVNRLPDMHAVKTAMSADKKSESTTETPGLSLGGAAVHSVVFRIDMLSVFVI
jgi:hypothetical protein